MDVGGVAHEEKWGSNGGHGPRVHEHKRGRGVRGQKPEIECDGSVSGYIRPLIDAGGFCEVKYSPAAVIWEGGELEVSRYGGRK